jgi:hypothetical protein
MTHNFDHYDLSRLEHDIRLSDINHTLDTKMHLTEKEKNLAMGIINYLHCPSCKFTSEQLFPNLNTTNNFEKAIINLNWMSKTPKGTIKPQCGACYGLLHHTCAGKNCDLCNGTGYRESPCKICATIPHHCDMCNSGYVMYKNSKNQFRRIVCPNIKKLWQIRYCSECKGTLIGRPKKCYGSCPLLQYSTKHSDKSEYVMGCACGRSHQIGDCKNLVYSRTGKPIKGSPYQFWISKCKYCGLKHPVVNKTEYQDEYRPKISKKSQICLNV